MKKTVCIIISLLVAFAIGFSVCFVSFIHAEKWTEETENGNIIVTRFFNNDFIDYCEQ